ncbi:MAG: CotH kinase family protein [Lachnospiraceae bacterium]|nr:CotH kinase family protein [Lachnospiraceae bacterium]
MKKKSTRFTILVISLVLTVLLVVGVLIFLAVKAGVLPIGNDHETKSVAVLGDKTTQAPPVEASDTEPDSEVVSPEAPVTEPSVATDDESTEDKTEENTTEESEDVWPHEREGVWAAFSHAEKEADLDGSMSVFSDASVSGKTALRLFGGQKNRLVFYNDSDAHCDIYFFTSVSDEDDDPSFTLKAGEEKEFRFSVKENTTVSYVLAYSGEAGNACYIPDNESLKQLNKEFKISSGSVIHLEGAASEYDVDELYKLPECEIVWKGNGVTGEFIALYTFATKWNDEDILGNYEVGGSADVKLNGVSILPAQNSFATKELKYEQSGNSFKVKLPIEVNKNTTTNTRLSISANGNVELSGEGLNPDGTVNIFKPVICKVTDANGQTHGYRLSATYESYNVPVVYITTSNGKMVSSKSTYITGTFSMDADHVPGIDSIPEMTMQIKGRGHSTWKKEKKPFNIKFDQKVSILGLPSNRDWVMLANYFDPTMSRNYISFELARQMNFDFTPSTFPVQVIYNGKYIGMYCIGDKVEIASGRVNQTKHSSEVDRDYLIEVRGYESGYRMGHSAFTAGLLRDVAIKNPEPEEITAAQYKYIYDYVMAANDAVVNLSNYEDYIDIDSLVDWFIITELTYNCDGAFNRSVYIEKRAGQKLKFQPVWDFDLALGNVGNLTPEYDSWACSQNGFTDTEITWGTYLVQDPKFMARLEKRWKEVRGILRSTATESLKTMRHLMYKVGDANFNMWVIPGERQGWEWSFVSDYLDYKQHMDYIEVFLEKRFNVMDKVLIDHASMRYYADGKLHGDPILTDTTYPVSSLTLEKATAESTEETENPEETTPDESDPEEPDTQAPEEETQPAEETGQENPGGAEVPETAAPQETEPQTMEEASSD